MKKEAELTLITQGVKGGRLKESRWGYVEAIVGRDIDNQTIIFDAFKGTGKTYQRREVTQIRIFSNAQAVFVGTFEELVELITKNK